MKTLLIDDHAVFRDALRVLLAQKVPTLEVVGEAGTARDAIALAREKEPDLVIMDVVLGGTNGIAATREIRRMPTRPRILMLTAVSEPAFVVDALGAGALGYALKADGADELVSAIEKTSRGQKYVAPALRDLLDARPTSLRDEASGVISTLSSREREVFDLVVAGYTNERMSQELFISVKTVETHRSRINKKLRVHSTVELIRFAALHGLFATQ